MATLFINVYASLLKKPGSNIDPGPSDQNWILALRIPTNKVPFRCYKWVLFAISVVTGAQGTLSTRPYTLHPVDFTGGLPTENVSLYYHISEEEKQRMLPIDPEPRLINTNVTSSVATTRQQYFHDSLVLRDGSCVLTGCSKLLCDGAHLISHCKGDMYIKNLTRRRSRGDDHVDIVETIDDTRNGILLNKLTHLVLGKDVAFIVTPNYGMTTEDVDPDESPESPRCTAHFFSPESKVLVGRNNQAIDTGSALQISDSADWPPTILFDAVYASVVLHHFGTNDFKDALSKFTFTKDTYPRGETELKEMKNEQASEAERRQKQEEEQDACQEARRGRRGETREDLLDMLLFVPFANMIPEQLREEVRKAEEKAQAAEQTALVEKVNDWRSHLPPA
ncbi:hypothetical protein B0F90DRAFT_1755259 [Multifurca ochricompacta]|uniref:HNH nuclease domain-containing protein n=1 Tax=Multifurca ochricompacta TaxID=376703 RepID=A0AAD4LY24_9AGAM|nr:hypothetical protein B0F90DRAFT_1755259 [Multifurca ochricompacta]